MDYMGDSEAAVSQGLLFCMEIANGIIVLYWFIASQDTKREGDFDAILLR